MASGSIGSICASASLAIGQQTATSHAFHVDIYGYIIISISGRCTFTPRGMLIGGCSAEKKEINKNKPKNIEMHNFTNTVFRQKY